MNVRKTTAVALALLVAACGGGSSSDVVPASADVTLSGVAATGGAIAGATITVTPASGTAKTTTAGADGSYSVIVTNMTAPLVITATGQVGDSQETLVSVLGGTAVLSGSTAANTVVNITPLTHAISATLSSSGNPLDLVTNIATEKANITATRITQAQDAFKTVLADVFTAAGISAADQASLNLFSTPFKADGTGHDKALDSIKVDVKPSGEITMTTVGAGLVDDTGTNAAAPTASKALVIAKGSLPVAGDKANLPAPSAGTAIVTVGDLQPLRQALIACFKLAAASRGTFPSPASACASFVVSSYKHQGRSGTQEFNALFADATLDGADFAPAEIIRQVGASKALVKFGHKRANGFLGSILTVVDKQSSGSWLMTGNQRNFEVFVNAFVAQRESLGGGGFSHKDTGLNLFVRNNPSTFAQDANITAVKVFGPGLPGFVDANTPGTGITLNKVTGCDFWSISATLCSNLLRLKVLDLSTGNQIAFASLSSGFKPFAIDPQLTDAGVTAILPDSIFKFELTVTGTGTVVFWERLRSRPYTNAEIGKVTFLAFTDASKALVNPSSPSVFTGGGKPTLNWTLPAGAAPAFTTALFHAANSDFQNVKPSDLTVTIPCTGAGNTNCDPSGNGNFKTGMNYTATGASFETRLIQLIARNRFDTQVFTQVSRP